MSPRPTQVRRSTRITAILALVVDLSCGGLDAAVDFVRDVQPIFRDHCVSCHGPEKQKSEYRLDVREVALKGGESGEAAIVPGKSAESPLMRFITGEDADMLMPPKKSDQARLSETQIATLRTWIEEGASWPESATTKVQDPRDWWSLKPLVRPPVPGATTNPIDGFIHAALAAKNLSPSPEADARTLCRRLYFDLTGLPPAPEEVDAFIVATAGNRDAAVNALVDRLLASPRYGERWARHWLDVVHFGETHGYDKDKPRLNAWPYRDYVIRAFNEDKPYARFVQEQLAGDAIFPGTIDGIEALGFIAAGPWDLIGHMEVPESKTDGKIARHLDRDDMVSNTINTFCSLTVHCAQCHNHKFDPISQEDYYSLQAVFAALDRADRTVDVEPDIASQRSELLARQRALKAEKEKLDQKLTASGGQLVVLIDRLLDEGKKGAASEERLEFGWHSRIEKEQNTAKWVQVDLGSEHEIEAVVLGACHDNFNNIGAGFGFPVRFKVEAANDPEFAHDVTVLDDRTTADLSNPGTEPHRIPTTGRRARYLRVTATKLTPRKGDFIFALGELQAFDKRGRNLALGAPVTSPDSIEAKPRWARANLTDGYYYGGIARIDAAQVAALRVQREEALATSTASEERTEAKRIAKELAAVDAALRKLPAPRVAYVGTVHTGTGAFKGTGADGGKPRPIFLLARGDVTKPGKQVAPGALSAIDGLPARFDPQHSDMERRAALARWITDPRHPLTWRSIVNRVWQYHFGRGLVDSPNDFGRMGQLPSHPELLDWLAVEFRDSGGSFKKLHKFILTSATYRQSVAPNERAQSIDSGNALLWRQNRRKLEAEAVRDSLLAVAGKLDLTMGGPSFQDFVIEKPQHSPHYQYHLADPEDPKLHRRSIYRFLVRSQQQPFMAALDCADPSMLVEKRNQTLTPLQALAQLNNQLALSMARHFATRIAATATTPDAQAVAAYRYALSRTPTDEERDALAAYLRQHGLANACRVVLNLNEFAFVD